MHHRAACDQPDHVLDLFTQHTDLHVLSMRTRALRGETQGRISHRAMQLELRVGVSLSRITT